MKIVLFEITPEEQQFLTEPLKEFSPVFVKEKLSQDNPSLAQDAGIISVFINSEVNSEIINALPQLKLIATRSTGYDHIDVDSAQKRGVAVVNVPAYGSRTVAEFTFALILNLSRKIFEAKHQIIESESFDISRLQGFDLAGKTIGVVGTGRIGKNVIKIALGFEMNVVACDPKPDADFAQAQGFKYLALDELLAVSDIVSLHTPYFKETHHLINLGNIGRIKKGALLINTARGELVETDALLKALTSGHLAGAGLDVLEEERQLKEETELLSHSPDKIKDFKILLQNHVLINLPQVIITPHIAFFSREAREEILKTTEQNIKSFIAGSPQNLI